MLLENLKTRKPCGEFIVKTGIAKIHIKQEITSEKVFSVEI